MQTIFFMTQFVWLILITLFKRIIIIKFIIWQIKLFGE